MRIASPTFAHAVYPDRWKIGRVHLHTLTLGHAVLLQRLGNPYAEAQGKPVEDLGKLAVAAFVCSRTAKVASSTVDGWWARNWMVWRALTWRGDYASREQEMRLYIAAAWLVPSFKSLGRADGHESRVPGTDPLHGLWVHRRTVMGETEEEAALCPVLRARLDRLAWLEEQGAIRVIPDQEEDTLLQAVEDNAEWDRELRGGKRHG